jgi:methionine-rich copper-binding protein CopC
MKTGRRRSLAWLPAALAALLTLILSATIAAAHSTTVTKAVPAAGSTVSTSPTQVMAQFSEEVVSPGSTLKVLDAGGKQVSQGDGKLDLNDPNHQIMLADLTDTLPDGVYTVQYHVVLTDGDATDDSYKFTVQSAAAPAAQPATAAAVPTAVATPVPTAAPTAAATTAATPPPAAAATPSALPTTGGASGQLTWPLAALGAAVLLSGLAVGLRRKSG